MMRRRKRRLSLLVGIFVCAKGLAGGFLHPRVRAAASNGRRHQLTIIRRHAATTDKNTTIDVVQHRKRQVRRKSRNRHPPGYWQDLSTVENEFRLFWKSVGVEIPPNKPPTIPNEALLNHFERYDLRYAIVSYGGRKYLSARLGGADVMHGRWKVAVKTSPELQTLLRNATHGLSPNLPPLSPQQKKNGDTNEVVVVRNQTTRWNHSPTRKPKGYWSLETVIKELYLYLDDYQEHYDRPSIWMPQPSELKRMGRDDLRQAIVRFGGSTRICQMAGLVPYREWNYFEGQYELLVGLCDYLDKYHEGDQATFPCASEMKRNGYHDLHALVQYFGGTKFLATRLSMKHVREIATRDYIDLNWGPFRIDTAIELLRFIRSDQMRKRAPLKRPVIAIPSQRKLVMNGQEELHGQIMELGGYESVARRLGLAYFE